MISFEWSVSSAFAELEKIASLLPDDNKIDVSVKENQKSSIFHIDLGGFEMVRRDISPEQLSIFISEISDGSKLSTSGRAVALYIEDKTNIYSTDSKKQLPKAHLFKCSSISTHGQDRYVMVVNPNGEFEIMFKGGAKAKKNLDICLNCIELAKSDASKFNLRSRIGKVDWNGWNKHVASANEKTKSAVGKLVKIGDKFTKHGERSSDFYGYTDDWNIVSRKRKEECNWTCSGCNVMLMRDNNKMFLDTHHLNRNKKDNSKENLKVLCRLCHRDEGKKNPNGFDDHAIMTEDPSWNLAVTVISKERARQSTIP
jgi:hypothetical protein